MAASTVTHTSSPETTVEEGSIHARCALAPNGRAMASDNAAAPAAIFRKESMLDILVVWGSFLKVSGSGRSRPARSGLAPSAIGRIWAATGTECAAVLVRRPDRNGVGEGKRVSVRV